MGITSDWDDYLVRELRFTPTDDVNSEKVLLQKKWMYDPVNDMEIGVNFNFVELVTENKYRQFGDQISLLGGFIAAIWASFWIMSPVLVFYFMLKFASIIMDKSGK